MRAEHDAWRPALLSRQRHRQVADEIDRYLEPDGARGRSHDVVGRLLARAVAIAHDAMATARRAAERFEQ
jgi:hypothetical protein